MLIFLIAVYGIKQIKNEPTFFVFAHPPMGKGRPNSARMRRISLTKEHVSACVLNCYASSYGIYKVWTAQFFYVWYNFPSCFDFTL